MSFTENIKLLCKKSGITIDKLSKDVGFCNKLIYHWDNTSPKLSNVIAVADYFDVSLDELIGRRSSNTVISKDEKELLSYYSNLNEQGKIALIAAAQGFATQSIYKKCDMVEEAQ